MPRFNRQRIVFGLYLLVLIAGVVGIGKLMPHTANATSMR